MILTNNNEDSKDIMTLARFQNKPKDTFKLESMFNLN